MNPVLILTHNCLELTKKCIASIQSQDIPTWTYLVDNDSSDETYEWSKKVENVVQVHFHPQIGVSGGWNNGLNHLFNNEKAEHVLVINNDVIIPQFFYRALLSCNLPFVSGVSSQDIVVAYAKE